MSNANKNTLQGYLFIILVFIVIIGSTIYFNTSKKTETQAVAGIASKQNASSSVSIYKDGNYSADGSYTTPRGVQSIGVTVTLKNDIITDVSVTENATEHESQEFQDIFTSQYKQYVVGKNIDTVQLDKVSGSSLTPNGFNNAIEQIKSEAKA